MPSSNSSPLDGAFARSLVQALELARLEAPGVYAQIRALLGTRRVGLSVGPEELEVGDDMGILVTTRSNSSGSAVTVRTDRATLSRLAAAKTTVLEMALEERLIIIGHTDDLLALQEATACFLRWSVRHQAVRTLFYDYCHAPQLGDDNA